MSKMALQHINPTKTKAWKELTSYFNGNSGTTIKELFAEDPDRAKKFTLKWNDFIVDYSKNRITSKTMELLLQLAREVDLQDAIRRQFDGDIINGTEVRAVLHTALRAKENDLIKVDGVNIIPEIYAVKSQIKTFTESIISGTAKGYTGK